MDDKKTGRSADNDPGLASLINANTKAVCVVGKSWDFHVKVALGIKNEENLENIRETTKHFVKNKKEFLFDAEHLTVLKPILIMLKMFTRSF